MKVDIKQLKKFLAKLPWTIAERAFFACLFLFVLALIFGGLSFYKYNILAQKIGFEALNQSLLLKEETYQEVLTVWQEQEKRFSEADSKEYPNPFEELVPFPGEEAPEEAPGEEEED